jgi:hypothetical protein
VDPVGLARVALVGTVVALLGAPLPSRAAEPDPLHIDLWADRDDDDADGVPDGEETPVRPGAFVDLVPLDPRLAGAVLEVTSGAEHVRLVGHDGYPVGWGRPVPPRAMLQGLSPGRVAAVARVGGRKLALAIDVSGVALRDGEGRAVDLARSHASIERTPPMRDEGGVDSNYDDFDALRVVLELPDRGPGLDGEHEVAVESVSAQGARLDEVPSLALAPLSASRCPPVGDVRCWASAPLRAVMDDVDRNHPLVAGRSVKAEVGGALVFRIGGRKAQMVRVLGPRDSSVGPIGRLRATLHPFVVRVAPGGAPAIGGTDAGAIDAVRAELGAASAIWGQCGISFGDPKTLEVKLVDPPPSHLVAIGDDLGVAASGGDIRLRADGKSIHVPTTPGEGADQVAENVARAVERAGLVAIVSPNARIGPGVDRSVDVSIRRKDGTLLAVDTPPNAPLSTDPTMSVRIGSVDVSDGLQHFTDVDAMAGTLEERTLLKSLDDADPAAVRVVVVPLFAGGGRIGESFIGSDLSSVRNVVLLDRAGIRARKSSLTLAHELGHVLLDLPGHPDDYGVDTPTLLMDSDAADASPFGPRRLTVEDCARAVRQAGPKARVPLLTEWPVGSIPSGPGGAPSTVIDLRSARPVVR